MGDTQHIGRASSAERMRRSRELRRKGLRCIRLHIRESEVAELVRRRLLAEADQDDPDAISDALGKLLDALLVPKKVSPPRGPLVL
jgi:hypothetical protein